MKENMNYNKFMAQLKGIQGMDAEYALESIGGSDVLYYKLLSQTIRIVPRNVEQMDGYIGSGDLHSFGITAHGIKGSLRQVGCWEMARTAEYLELKAKEGGDPDFNEIYRIFKAKLLNFCGNISSAISNAGTGSDSESEVLTADISNYKDILLQAKDAVEDFDSILAAELLSPIMNKRFDDSSGNLLLSAMEELESFRLQTSLEYISRLIEKCGHSD